ncbi:uncharacterized protein RHIMIDRAFT_271249 [Rhizopus microsporus ATCC 52813]|uniref:Uncharacterized protein n=2 Tax=Rhizopus microsporus TaxID=58291 RepID=A0A2G4SGL9_RHIZD|nr:uncharacterized protein RHIMIDRAFT_271249 [Rhizopus microsporus ATCC 52813]PHZ07905.1 hypothetical protein RHIMIDRAFT_271249 [Rhizopus microsporus ATCC 52813]
MATIDDLLHVCDNASLKFEEGINILQGLPDSNSKKRAIDCLNDVLEVVKAYKCKYMPCPSPPAAQNWLFVERYLQSLGNEPMNWEACLVEGQQQGYLKNYTKSTSLKAVYLRWKKNKK